MARANLMSSEDSIPESQLVLSHYVLIQCKVLGDLWGLFYKGKNFIYEGSTLRPSHLQKAPWGSVLSYEVQGHANIQITADCLISSKLQWQVGFLKTRASGKRGRDGIVNGLGGPNAGVQIPGALLTSCHCRQVTIILYFSFPAVK